jgi:hypothetical protein
MYNKPQTSIMSDRKRTAEKAGLAKPAAKKARAVPMPTKKELTLIMNGCEAVDLINTKTRVRSRGLTLSCPRTSHETDAIVGIQVRLDDGGKIVTFERSVCRKYFDYGDLRVEKITEEEEESSESDEPEDD